MRIFLDVCIFSESWFSAALDQMARCETVRFAFVKAGKIEDEYKRLFAALKFLNIMSQRNRVDFATVSGCSDREEYLTSCISWQNEPACDDANIFSMIVEKPVRYIFTTDSRIATCRDKIRNSVGKEYCRFSLISNESNWRGHRSNILR